MEYAMVTVYVEQMNWKVDMELPARMKIKDLVGKMLETLKMFDEDRFGGISRIRLLCQNKELHSEATLADYQIWDGSILTVMY